MYLAGGCWDHIVCVYTTWCVQPCPTHHSQKQRLKASQGEEQDERKRKYNSVAGGDEEVTAEDMEAFRMTRKRADDPMLAFKKTSDKDGGGYDYV